jgi:hypothetical protein
LCCGEDDHKSSSTFIVFGFSKNYVFDYPGELDRESRKQLLKKRVEP